MLNNRHTNCKCMLFIRTYVIFHFPTFLLAPKNNKTKKLQSILTTKVWIAKVCEVLVESKKEMFVGGKNNENFFTRKTSYEKTAKSHYF